MGATGHKGRRVLKGPLRRGGWRWWVGEAAHRSGGPSKRRTWSVRSPMQPISSRGELNAAGAGGGFSMDMKYLEDKPNKSKADLCAKVMKRRRQDVQDQISELSSKLVGTASEDNTDDANRQQRVVDREGRRREQRRATTVRHYDGMSSTGEVGPLDQGAGQGQGMWRTGWGRFCQMWAESGR